jgi:hypothetical protein
MGYAYG